MAGYVAVQDQTHPDYVLIVNSDGSINVKQAATGTFEASALANASAPSWSEGTVNPLSQNLTGDLRVIAKQNGTWTVGPTKSATGTQTSVASSGSSVTVLAANANRLGATVYNDSTQILYLLLVTGGTASTTAYTVQLTSNAYYEVPYNYTGALIGIWASANGNARVTEFT